MPISLLPNRRHFMAASIAGALAARGLAGEERANVGEARIALLADTHIPTDAATESSKTNMAANFKSVVQTSGFAESTGGTAPSSVSGAIGSGYANGQLLVINADGSVATFNYSSGSVSFRSDAPSGSCPRTNPSPATVCTLETMHVTFTLSATQSATGSLERHASIATEMSVPAMRLTYTP